MPSRSKLYYANLLIHKLVSAVVFYHTFLNEKQKIKFLKRSRKIQSYFSFKNIFFDNDLYESLEILLASLHHGHTKIYDYPTKLWYAPAAVKIIKRAGFFYLLRSGKIIGRVLTIDDRPVINILRDHQRRIASDSATYRRHQATKFLLLSKHKQPVTVLVSFRGRRQTLSLNRITVKHEWPEPFHFRSLGRRLGYFRITRWCDEPESSHQITNLINKLRRTKSRGLIIDVRGNGGGSTNPAYELIGHFIKKKIGTGWVTYRSAGGRMRKRTLSVQPRQPHLKLPIAILTDIDCYSSNEIFIASMHDNGIAKTFGETTGGSSGCPITKKFSAGQFRVTAQIATWRYFRPNNKSLEGRGLIPDYPVKADPTRKSDLVLTRAKSWLLSKH